MSFCRIQLENYNILIFFKINTSSSRYFYLLLFICNRKKLNRVFLTYRLTSWKVMPSCWNTEKINEKQSMIFLLSLPLPFFTKTLSSKFWFCHCTEANTHFWFNHTLRVTFSEYCQLVLFEQKMVFTTMWIIRNWFKMLSFT